MKNLLSPSTKTRIKTGIGVFLFAIAATFGLNSCDTSTSPINGDEQPHPDFIGMIGDVEIRASFAITPEQEADLLERLTAALNHDIVTENTNRGYLEIIEITGFGLDGLVFEDGVMTGNVTIDGALAGQLRDALNAMVVLNNSNTTEEEILLAEKAETESWLAARAASRAEQRIIL